ncbi:hypothetical protein [Arenimonas malthae]|uniref:hypothetical protein n=1 Tax=Arenimonas malthae TaxID=354197 RepID=UPI0012EBC7BB|nr:hypothetical protein [Arenimonas malthae]
MDRTWLTAAKKLEFNDPKPFLANLRRFEQSVAVSDTPDRIKNLRTNGLKSWREARDAALFCYGMSQRIGQTVYFAPAESQDYDFVASWIVGHEQHLTPVQLKEVVPKHLNPNASLEGVLASLAKYVDSSELTVAVKLNQQGRFQPGELVPPQLNISALWVFAATTPDQSEWTLWGNFLEQPESTAFRYPA